MSPKSAEDKLLPRRFELIKKMYFSDKVVAPVKKDKIFDWFFTQLKLYRKNNSSLQYQLLWETFYDILLEEKQISSGNRILIKSQSVEVLLEAVKNYPHELPWAPVILSSAFLFVETSTVNSTLIADLRTLLNLLIQSLKIMCISHSKQQQSFNEATKLASTILDLLENLPSADENIKMNIFSKSLKDIACFIHISDSQKKMKNIAERLIRQITLVFLNLKTKPYEKFLTCVAHDKQEVQKSTTFPQKFLSSPFYSLHMNLLSDEIYLDLPVNLCSATLMKNIVLDFMVQNKSSFQSLKVLSLFFAMNGVDIPIALGTNSCCNSLFVKQFEKSEINLLRICHLLEACSAVPQYFISVAAPEGYVTPSLWLQGVSASLLKIKATKDKAFWLKCFQYILQIAPTTIDSDIVALIKSALLNINVHDSESKLQYCELFKAIIKTHLQLHQTPKFFVKFLLALTECIKENSGGVFVNNGQILPEIEEAVAKCVQELPYGQMIEIWRMFNSTFSTLENMSEVFNTSRSFIFLVSQLLSTFLLHAQLFHANIPSNFHSQFKGLIRQTSAEVEKNISSLKELDHLKFAPLKRSILLLSYAIGELKLAYNAFYGIPVDDFNGEVSDNIFDCSVLHNFLDKDYAPVLESFVKGSDKVMAVLVFQLLLQKVKAFQFKDILTENETDHIQNVVSSIWHYLEASCTAVGPWDSDLCLVTKRNYGTVMWKMFLKAFPILLPTWRAKDIHALSNVVQHILLEDKCYENDAKCAIMSSLKHDVFQESKHFQTALLSVIWKQDCLLTCKERSHAESEVQQSTAQRIFRLLNAYHTKGLKYVERTPKSNKSLGSTWNEIKEIADLLNSVLLSGSLPKDKLVVSKLANFLQFFHLLPLDYLLPGNQMKCIFGLSLMLFLVPQSCKSEESYLITKEISSVLLSIFEGVRSIWLFDFVTSGPYLEFITKTLEVVITDECCDIDWAEQLIDHLISFIVRSADSLKSIESNIVEFSKKQKSSRTVLMIYRSLLKKLHPLLPRPHKLENYSDILSSISTTTCTSFVKYMKKNFNKELDNKEHSYFILCYSEVVEILCLPAFQASDDLKKECLESLSTIPEIANEKISNSNVTYLIDVYLIFISNLSKHCMKISSFLPDDFESASWNIILSHFERMADMKKDDNISEENTVDYALDAMPCSICLCKCDENRIHAKADDENTKNLLNYNLILLNDPEKESLKLLSSISSEEKLLGVFEQILSKMVSNLSQIDVSTFHIYIQIFQSLIVANPEKCQQESLNLCVQKCLTFSYNVMNQICYSPVCQTMVLIPCLDFISFILAGNKNIPKNLLYQSLHCVVPVPPCVQNDDYELYSRTFTAAWNVVYELFMYQTAIILDSPAPFLTYVSKLLKSIIKTGSVKELNKCNHSVLQKIQLCAQNMNRLLTVISRHKNEFAKLVPYLVADYVDSVQNITLETNIKESILSGIYRLLDLCSEESIKMLAVNINYIGREIYENLVKNYKQIKYTGGT